MKKVFGILAALFIAAGSVFAQEESDDFFIDLSEDFTEAQEDSAAESTSSEKSGPAIKQGIWIEATSHNNSLIRDIATGEKSGYEFDNSHFASKANWWFWGNVSPLFMLDAEISVWKFDKTLYQADSYGANVPDVTWGDGLETLASIPFSFVKGMNDDGVGLFNKMGFTIHNPYVNVKFGYGDLKANGMLAFTGIYNVIDRWNNVGNGFTEISNGNRLRTFGDFTVNATAALSRMRGTFGTYNLVDLRYSDVAQLALTFGSVSTKENLFYYNEQNRNAASVFAKVSPLDFLNVEAHGIYSFGTEIESGMSSTAVAGRISYVSDVLTVSLSESYAGSDVDSVWGSDGQKYDDINAGTSTSKIALDWNAADFISVGLDETLTFADVNALSDSKMTVRNQPSVDFDFNPLFGKNIRTSAYGVVNVDRLASDVSADRGAVLYLEEAGIEVTAENLARYLKKITADYAVSLDYQDWKEGLFYDYSVLYNSVMINADITERLNVHAGSLVRVSAAENAAFVPAGFALGASFKQIPLPGKPMLWAHFTYGMNPYEDNNYTLFRADDPLNKPLHRTYLLNSLYEDVTTSQISLGLIWNL